MQTECWSEEVTKEEEFLKDGSKSYLKHLPISFKGALKKKAKTRHWGHIVDITLWPLVGFYNLCALLELSLHVH